MGDIMTEGYDTPLTSLKKGQSFRFRPFGTTWWVSQTFQDGTIHMMSRKGGWASARPGDKWNDKMVDDIMVKVI